MDDFFVEKDSKQSFFPKFAAQQRILREELFYLIAHMHPSLRADVLQALKAPGKLLFQDDGANHALSPLPAGSWSLLVFFTGQCVSSQVPLTLLKRVSVALECFICALDLLDDVEDEDRTSTILAMGTARSLNVATALLTLAQKTMLSLSQVEDVPLALVVRLSQTLQDAAMRAIEGQQRDIVAEGQPIQSFTQEECIEIASQKAGSLISLACSLGAVCAGASEDVCEKFAHLGTLLGIAAQLDNDAHDLYYLLDTRDDIDTAMERDSISSKTTKTDFIRKKKTLPLVLASLSNDGTTDTESASIYEVERRYENIALFSEAIYTTWGLSLLYRERAMEYLNEIEESHVISAELRSLLSTY